MTIEKCVWADTGDSASWQSSCGKNFDFDEGGPVENGFKFCYSCGQPLEEIPTRFDVWGDPIEEDDDEGLTPYETGDISGDPGVKEASK